LFDLSAVLTDVINDFRLLADDEGRDLVFGHATGCWVRADQRFCRQIAHSLLSNALTHGRGAIRLRLLARGGQIRFTVLNQVRCEPGPQDGTLGLGLRVVRALLGQQRQLRFRRHAGSRYHATCLALPAETARLAPVVEPAAVPSGFTV
jgi:signal transduction histidine kinase